MIVNAARWLASHTLDGADDETLMQAMSDQAVFVELNLYAEDLETLADKGAAVQSLLDSLTL